MATPRSPMEVLGHGTVYRTTSSSRPMLSHITVLADDGSVTCTCEGFRSHKKCWHATKVQPEDNNPEWQVSL